MTSINVSHKGMCDASTQLSAGADTVTTANTTTTTSRRGSRRIGRKLFAFVAALSLAAGTLTTVTPAAEAALPKGKITATVNTRSGPGVHYGTKGSISKGSSVTMLCYSAGDSVNGNIYWHRLSNGAWVSDYYVNLGNKNPYQAGFRDCSGFTVTTVTAGVNARSGPGTGWSSQGTLAKGTYIAVACYTSGTKVSGNSWWDRLSDGSWVSEAYIKNPSKKHC